MTYKQDCEAKPQVLIWGESELAQRVTAKIGRHLPVIRAFFGVVGGQPAAGVNLLQESRMRRVDGTCGNFSVEIETDGSLVRQDVGAIVVFPEPRSDIATEMRMASEADHPLTLVVILEMTSPGVMREVLAESLVAVSRGHRVYLVVDEVQVSCPGGDELYQTARRHGVIFFKDATVNVSPCNPGEVSGQETMTWETNQEPGSLIVEISSGSMGKIESWVIEADRVLKHAGCEVREDYRELLKLLRVDSDLQEYYPFKTSRAGILVVDPRWGEPFAEEEIAACLRLQLERSSPAAATAGFQIQPDLCALCLTCFRTCPHRAVRFGQPAANMYGQAMVIDPVACYICGRCYAECPAQAIRPVQSNDSPAGVMVLACENSGAPLLEGSGIPWRAFPCAGSIGITDILKALEDGVNRVVVMTCREGKCQHGAGGKRLLSRVERLNRLLESVPNPVKIEVWPVSAQDRAETVWGRLIKA